MQSALEDTLDQLEPSVRHSLVAAGRTDAGVHAAAQVAHFDSVGPIPPHRWPAALNGRLPQTIRIRAAAEVSSTWHACYSAQYRRYRYTIYNAQIPNLFLEQWSWHRYKKRLDEHLMAAALADIVGEHDFAAFQRAGSHRAHSRTTVQDVSLVRQGDLLVAEIQASGFLYGMVRLLMGQVVAVGEGSLSLDAFISRWRRRARHEVREAAPANGLCLLRVGYPSVVFPLGLWYDTQPRFVLDSHDQGIQALV